MKKRFLVVLIIIICGLLAILAGCSKPQKPSLNMQIVLVDGGISPDYENKMLDSIKNSRELNAFIVKNRTKYSLYQTSSLIKAFEKYDEEFFKNNYLVLYYKADGTGSTKYTLKKSEIIDNNLEIYINQEMKPHMNNIRTYHFFIAEVPNDNNVKNINFNFVEVYK